MQANFPIWVESPRRARDQETNYRITLHPWSDRLILGTVFEKGLEGTDIDQAFINKLLKHAPDFFKNS